MPKIPVFGHIRRVMINLESCIKKGGNMSRRLSPNSFNKLLSSYNHFGSEEEARAFVKAHRWRKYVISSNADGTCWTVYHKER